MSDSGIYYDWNRTFTYNADINVVISMRGLGKTYGLRKAAIQDWIKDGSRFVEVVRTKESIKGEKGIQNGYFDKLVLKGEFKDYQFKINGVNAYIAHVPQQLQETEGEEDADLDDEDVEELRALPKKRGSKAKSKSKQLGKSKIRWHHIGYFVALSEMQSTKGRTFVNVKKVIFDEFIIDKRTRARYLPDEFGLFANLMDSVIREEVDETGNPVGTKVHAYLLGNACDLTNPYFIRWGINKPPRKGYSWHYSKMVLLHYADNDAYKEGKRKTFVGRLIAGTEEEKVIVDNVFKTGDDYNIGRKSKTAHFWLGIVYNGRKFGLWMDENKGQVYVTDNMPEGSGAPILALSKEDNTVNYLMARKSDKTLKMVMDIYYMDIMVFQNFGIRDTFLEALKMFGLR